MYPHRVAYYDPAMTTSIKAYKGIGMEGPIAKWYAASTRRDLDEFKALARRVAGELPAGGSVLEVAPGPGYFCIELAKLGAYEITGLDISKTFVEMARRNAAEAKVQIDFRRGNASGMPFGKRSFDFLLCRAAFKNFSQPARALQEMKRVLRRGGRALIIDLRPDASREAVNEYVDRLGQGRLHAAFMKLAFWWLRKRAHSKAEWEGFLSQAQFRSAEIRETGGGFEVWLEK